MMFAELKKLWRRLKRSRGAETAAAKPAAGGKSLPPAAAQKSKHPAPVVPPPSPPAASPPRSARAMPPEKAACVRVNRHGLRMLKGDEDLFLLFSRECGGGQAAATGQRRQPAGPRNTPAPGSPAADRATGGPSGPPPRRDRHGLPVLAAEADLETLFGLQPESETPARTRPAPPSFGRLVQRSLAERDLQRLLEEKIRQERRGAQKMSLRQQIKSHPLPQRQLDLHGCTAVQAQQRTEAFVRGALHAELATLRIIVGKGLHSQGRAVLPDAVAEKLSELKRRGQVLTFQWEKHKKSRSGALIVYL
jgi:DNA-nicking Smr family endonuclease